MSGQETIIFSMVLWALIAIGFLSQGERIGALVCAATASILGACLIILRAIESPDTNEENDSDS